MWTYSRSGADVTHNAGRSVISHTTQNTSQHFFLMNITFTCMLVPRQAPKLDVNYYNSTPPLFFFPREKKRYITSHIQHGFWRGTLAAQRPWNVDVSHREEVVPMASAYTMHTLNPP